jgi:hypothetical protein
MEIHSDWIANHHPDEIRYNVFQSLQYFADWLSGNDCVALPALLEGAPVRVMDDSATIERSRWEVWHQIHHGRFKGRFKVEEFLKIANEELHFIRKNLFDPNKIIQVKWDERTEKWYPIAFRVMVQLITRANPVEFVTELLLPFTTESIRNSADPWSAVREIEPEKYALDPYIERFCTYFSICGNVEFAGTLARKLVLDIEEAERMIKNFDMTAIQGAAWFHGDIGESRKTLDKTASEEQAKVLSDSEEVRSELKIFGETYKQKFGVKFLISAKGKSAQELLSALKERLENTQDQEMIHAKNALWEISSKRLINQSSGKSPSCF